MEQDGTWGEWRKSRRSVGNGECVEVGSWRKSQRCPHDTDCVEVGHGGGLVGVRDSKDGGRGPILGFTPEEWQEFTRQLAGQPAYPGPDHPYEKDAADWWTARDA